MDNQLESRDFIRMDYYEVGLGELAGGLISHFTSSILISSSISPYDCLLDLLLLDASPVDLLKCDGFLAKNLIYIPSATICRQKKESSA
jgi:hypothetical protein